MTDTIITIFSIACGLIIIAHCILFWWVRKLEGGDEREC